MNPLMAEWAARSGLQIVGSSVTKHLPLGIVKGPGIGDQCRPMRDRGQRKAQGRISKRAIWEA